MKILSYIFAAILTLVITVYVLLFTPAGTPLITNLANTKIINYTDLPVKIKSLLLKTDKLEAKLNIGERNTVFIKGEYSLLKKSFHINYDIKIDDLSLFSKIADTKLQGKLYTKGYIKGYNRQF